MAAAMTTAAAVLLAALADAASLRRSAVANVPTGECYECEVTCFEDCLMKYDREIIQEDALRARKYEQEKRRRALKKAVAAKKPVNPEAAGQEVHDILKRVFSKIHVKSAALAQAASRNSTAEHSVFNTSRNSTAEHSVFNTTRLSASRNSTAEHSAASRNSTASEEASTASVQQVGHSVFNWRRGGTSVSEEVSAVVARYEQCLEAEKCRGHRATRRKLASPWAARALKNPACQKPKQSPLSLLGSSSAQCMEQGDHLNCSVRTCGMRALQTRLSLVQEDKDVPLHPVVVGSFSKGAQTLDMCMKSCLAATCGCMHGTEKLGGFEKIDQLEQQIRANDEAGNPVLDTPPEYTYRPAFQAECGNGAAGVKITKGLYSVFHEGWFEVCSEDYLTAMHIKDVKKATDHCQKNDETSVDHGCVWSPFKNACVFGLKPAVRCNVRELKDLKL